MSVKTVTLSEDAYKALAALKREGESFSDVVRRLALGNRSLLEFAGDWKGVPAEKMEAYLAFLQTSDELSRTRLKRVARRGSR
ncbi:MAG: antitoxin VapB family protein [Thermoplasmata archaeon]